jgi:hypothetical protein
VNRLRAILVAASAAVIIATGALLSLGDSPVLIASSFQWGVGRGI